MPTNYIRASLIEQYPTCSNLLHEATRAELLQFLEDPMVLEDLSSVQLPEKASELDGFFTSLGL